MKLPTPGDWLNEQLAKMKMSQNEAALKAGISSGTLTKFAAGDVSAKAAVAIANFFNVPTQLTLAMVGLAPAPASLESAEAERLGMIYMALTDENKEKLLTFAEFLRTQN